MTLDKLDRLTDQTTAWSKWDDLVAACRRGYVPTVRSDKRLQVQLAVALKRAGLRAWFSC